MIINSWIITQVHILDRHRSLQEIGRRKIEEEQTGTEPNLYGHVHSTIGTWMDCWICRLSLVERANFYYSWYVY
jgi:hypothetical protein